ncbi:hypothetical protein OHB44_10055 [Micromonospora sp. NBC_00821]|uniref:hypothetical protein n=1 Tax=Micromonospora sp. NBC_00821 TaxID=2975977 RepID=UPI002ED39F31|nr:hypothetical protein OHB44_10055 [Micromonospora sp. NBC_00821]
MSRSSAAAVTADSRRLLKQLISRSSRTSGVQFPPAFLRDDDGLDPPLSRILRGGQGGDVRLKLYLTMTLLAARHPHDIRGIPAATWAHVLGLPEPKVNGARRIGDALDFLAGMKLIGIAGGQGRPRNVLLRDPSGNGTTYSWRGNRYISMPLGFWANEWIYRLTGSSVALLLVLRDMRSNRQPSDAPWLTTDQKRRYGLSEATWTRATKELTNNGLLIVRRRPQGRDFDYRRLRNTYWVSTERLDDSTSPPATPPQE